MKKILCGAILCLSFINSYSQIYSLSDIESDLSAMFAGLDKSRITTGFLWDKSANLVEPALFNGQFLVDSNYVDLPVFHDIIFSLNSASTGPAIMEPDSIISLIQNRTHNQTIAVGFLFQKYNYITADALSCGKINYNNGVVSDSYNGDVSKLSESKGPRRIISRGLTKAYSPEDSIRRLHAFQSDKEKMLLNQIKKRDGVYVLDLTKEDAKELNIPDSLYLWATQVVEALKKED